MASNGEPVTLECRETLQSMFSFAKIEIAAAIPQKNSCWYHIMLITSVVIPLGWLKKEEKEDEEEAEEKHVLAGCCFATLVLLTVSFFAHLSRE